MSAQSASNPVEGLFGRLEIAHFYPAFKDRNVDKLITLRQLPESELAVMIPDAEARSKLVTHLSRRPTDLAGDRGRGGRGRGGEERGRGRGRGGDDRGGMRRPFDPAAGTDGAAAATGESGGRAAIPPKDVYSEEISVPWESVRLLLANKAEKLTKINHRCGTANTRFERPEAYQATFSITLQGTKEGVKMARSEIEHFVGITGAQNREARFDYANNELQRNMLAVRYLLAANLRHRGTSMELSESILQRVVSTFRFQQPPKIAHFWVLSASNDKDKFETVANLVKNLQGVQGILFTDAKRIEEMAKRSKNTADSFGVRNPVFVHRKLPKEERRAVLSQFKAGEPNAAGVKQRLLVTNDDYAKYARKVPIPYVNLVVHFAMPASKEMYLHQAMCTGRQGQQGISVLFVTHYDSATQKEWAQSIPLQPIQSTELEAAIRSLTYDTVDAPLTAANADPDYVAPAAAAA